MSFLAAVDHHLPEACSIKARLAIGEMHWRLADHGGATGDRSAPDAAGSAEDSVHVQDVIARIAVVGQDSPLGENIWHPSSDVPVRYPDTRKLCIT